MGLFTRKGRPEPAEPLLTGEPEAEVEDEGQALGPESRPPGPEEHDRIAASVEQFVADGVEIDGISSLGAGLDAAYADWARTGQGDHSVIVERYSIGIGEHLPRHTDLGWRVVTDVFGTDLGLLDGPRGTFMVVPSNLVAGRWMRGETGWIPAVVGHLVRCRER